MTSADKLYFYKKSADKPAGSGVHDEVADPSAYAELNKIPNWRKRIDEFYVAPFLYDNLHYNSVSHMSYAKHVALYDPEKAKEFALESGSDLSKLDYHVYESRPTKKQQAWDAIKDDVMYEGNIAKFEQHPDLKEILLLTNDAELWYTPDRGSPAERREVLEEVREHFGYGSEVSQ